LNQHFVQLSEKLVLKQANSRIFCLNEKDSNLINTHYGLKSHTVDLILENHVKNCVIDKLNNSYCLFGSWNRPENLESLIWVLKNLYDKIPPNYYITVIGGGLNNELIDNKKYDRVKFTGFLVNPYPIIASSKALLAPLFNGAGVKVKVIESLACGTPVIGTDVALEGITFKHHLFMRANSIEDFSRSIQRVRDISLDEKRALKKLFLAQYPKKQFSDDPFIK
jgi:glycosyltransferase involved in cell wall biosynthesis